MMIRSACVEDIPQLNKLLFQVQQVHAQARPDIFVSGAKKYTDDELFVLIQSTDQTPIFVAELDGVVVGYAFCQIIRASDHMRKQNTLYIDDLCVDATHRRKHIGSDLLNYVIALAKKMNFHNVTLNVWALNKDAYRFYEKNGMHVQKYGMEKII
jgi:ribosomal protein S18 acetylase RimI-like enzyme